MRGARRSSWGKLFLLLLAAGNVIACGEHRTATETCDAGGRAVVTLAQLDSAPVFEVTLERRIGTVESDTSQMFGWITDIAVGGDEQLFVADGYEKSTFVFDGGLVRRIGRKGDGPGEFRSPMVLQVTRADTLAVFDTRLWRLSLFSRDGNLARIISPTRLADFGQIPEVEIDGSGRLYYLSYSEYVEDLDPFAGAAVQRGGTSIVTWDEAENEWIRILDVPGIEIVVQQGGLMDAPYGRRPLWAAVPDGGVWYGDSGEYEIARYSLAGLRQCELRIADYPRQPVSGEERQAYYLGTNLRDPSPEQLARVRQSRREIRIPDHKPALKQVLVADDGNIWVRAGPTGSQLALADTLPVWHVFTPNGRLLGLVQPPVAFSLRAIRGERMYGVYRDALGVNYVLVYRFSKPGI